MSAISSQALTLYSKSLLTLEINSPSLHSSTRTPIKNCPIALGTAVISPVCSSISKGSPPIRLSIENPCEYLTLSYGGPEG